MDIRLTAIERQQGREALASLLATQPPSVRGCVGLATDAIGDRRSDMAWWHCFVAVFEPGIAGYALVEVLSAASVRSQLGARYPRLYSGDPRKLASLLANLSLFVSADCSVLGLASAAGVPSVGIFRTTEPLAGGRHDASFTAVDARNLTPERVAENVLDAFRSEIAMR